MARLGKINTEVKVEEAPRWTKDGIMEWVIELTKYRVVTPNEAAVLFYIANRTYHDNGKTKMDKIGLMYESCANLNQIGIGSGHTSRGSVSRILNRLSKCGVIEKSIGRGNKMTIKLNLI